MEESITYAKKYLEENPKVLDEIAKKVTEAAAKEE